MTASVLASQVAGPHVDGRLAMLSCPAALCPHAEFALAGVLDVPVALRWTPQPCAPGTLRSALAWRGPVGTANRLAAALRALGPLAFDVEEPAAPGWDAERYSYVPELGLLRLTLTADGQVAVPEARLRAALERCDASPGDSGARLAAALAALLGDPWDAVLEPLRRAGDGHPVTVLRRTG